MNSQSGPSVALSSAAMADLARSIFANVKGLTRLKQTLRPYICPFHIVVGLVPPNARVLDAGCGTGLFIALLARLEFIKSAVGFDASQAAILTAQQIRPNLPNADAITFEHRDATMPWPEGIFDVVSLIDVMHHIRPENHSQVIACAAERLNEGGILIYKDMARKPLWRAWANRLHDLLAAGEWINYAKIEDVVDWATSNHLRLEDSGSINMLWYRHDWLVLRRMRRES